MRKFKVGVWLKDSYSPKVGGGSSYYHRLMSYIDQHDFKDELEVFFIKKYSDTDHKFKKDVIVLPKPKGGKYHFLNFLHKIISLFPLGGKGIARFIEKFMMEPNLNAQYGKFLSDKLHLLYFPIQGHRYIPNFPCITTNWDISHSSTFPFPEVTMGGKYMRRELWVNKILPQSIFIFVESDAGKAEILQKYSIHPEKLKVVPLFSGSVSEQKARVLDIEILKNKPYFLYPAQFWPHKNHYNLIIAFKQFLHTNKDAYLALTGGDKDNHLNYIKKVCEEEGVIDRVLFLGFVEKETLAALYTNAMALVMPTFFGPTNMPLAEARELGCPVLCSNLEGHKEMLGDGALYFNPRKPTTILEAMLKVNEPTTRTALLAKATELKEHSKFNIHTAVDRIDTYFLEAKNIRLCWEKSFLGKGLNFREHL